MLPAELCPAEPPVAKALPETSLCVGLLSSKPPGSRLLLRAECRHGRSILPAPGGEHQRSNRRRRLDAWRPRLGALTLTLSREKMRERDLHPRGELVLFWSPLAATGPSPAKRCGRGDPPPRRARLVLVSLGGHRFPLPRKDAGEGTRPRRARLVLVSLGGHRFPSPAKRCGRGDPPPRRARLVLVPLGGHRFLSRKFSRERVRVRAPKERGGPRGPPLLHFAPQ